VLALVFLFGAGIFPNLVKSTLDPVWDITIFDAASSRGTMLTMLVVVSFGMPFVLLYTAITYWTFRGRVGGDGDGPAVVERRA
jgi:cytochrome d ubiquinol oxidase subunit II